MIPTPPLNYSGQFSAFYREYVDPHLPSVERVLEFDGFLRSYLNSEDPIYIVRYVKSQERGTISTSALGKRILPTDNSPVWWIHEYLRSARPLIPNAKFFSNLPAHMFKLPRDRKYLNTTGFHAAHIVKAKDGNVDWKNWSQCELLRRTLLNIHPCNMFLVAKCEWTASGGRPDILRWIEREYQTRYGGLMQRFLKDVSVDLLQDDKPNDPFYEYGLASQSRSPENSKYPEVKIPRKKGKLRLLSRPLISKTMLGQAMILEIKDVDFTYRIEHDALVEWVGNNLNALNTPSWTEKGLYSWPKTSRKMLEFLGSFRI